MKRSLYAFVAFLAASAGVVAVAPAAHADTAVSGTALRAGDLQALPAGTVRIVVCAESTTTNFNCSDQVDVPVDADGDYTATLADGSWYLTPFTAAGPVPANLGLPQIVHVVGGVADLAPDFLLHAGTVSGSVTNQGSTALPAGSVSVIACAASIPWGVNCGGPAAAIDAGGQYSLVLPDGDWAFGVGTTPSLSFGATTPVTVGGDAQQQDLTIAAGMLSGTVLHGNATPFAAGSAQVVVCPVAIPVGSGTQCTFFAGGISVPVAPDGSYSVLLPAGTWYAMAVVDGAESAPTGGLPVNTSTPTIQSFTVSTAEVSGTVRDATTGAPIGSVAVQFCPGSGSVCPSPRSTITAPDGTYSLALLPSTPTWTPHATGQGGAQDVRPTISISDGDQLTVDFQITGGTLTGVLQDASGAPVPFGVALELCTTSTCRALGVTGPSFSIANLPQGTYDVYAVAIGTSALWRTVPAGSITITDGLVTAGVVLRLGGGAIDVSVTDGTNVVPSPSITACLQNVMNTPTGDACSGHPFNVSGGHAVLTGLPAGTYTVTASAPGFASATASGVVVTSSSTPHVDLVLGAPASVTGTVSGNLGTTAAVAACPAPNDPSPAFNGLGSPCTTAGGTFTLVNLATGSYSLTGLTPGAYRLRAYAVVGSAIVPGSVVSATLAGGLNVVNLTMGAADDGDGVAEDPAVDGNGDGIPDAQQPNVTTLPAGAGGGNVTIDARGGANYTLEAVSAVPVPASPAPPAGANLPLGLLGFTVNLPAGMHAADVQVTTPAGTNPTSYFKFQNNTWIDFTGHVSFSGDVITLHLVDGGVGDADGLVNGVIVDPGGPGVNHLPTAATDTATTAEDAATTINVVANDSANDPGQTIATTAAVSVPAHGTAARVTSGVDTGKIRYVPSADYFGPDSFTYQVCDSGLPSACATGTVNVTVTPVNDAPRARLDGVVTNEDTPRVIDVLGNDDAGPGESTQTLTVTSVSKPFQGSAAVVTIGPDKGRVLYTPGPNVFVADAFTYTACDNGVPVKCATSAVGVAILPVNDAPTISSTPDKATKKNKAVSFSVAVGDVDNPAGSLDVLTSSSNTALVPAANVDISGSGATRTVKVTPVSNKTGTATITLTVRDPLGATSSDSFVVTVTN